MQLLLEMLWDGLQNSWEARKLQILLQWKDISSLCLLSVQDESSLYGRKATGVCSKKSGLHKNSVCSSEGAGFGLNLQQAL